MRVPPIVFLPLRVAARPVSRGGTSQQWPRQVTEALQLVGIWFTDETPPRHGSPASDASQKKF
jgi:hypothetical protein